MHPLSIVYMGECLLAKTQVLAMMTVLGREIVKKNTFFVLKYFFLD
jgi:hypothetical protein